MAYWLMTLITLMALIMVDDIDSENDYESYDWFVMVFIHTTPSEMVLAK
jgi:hypothetical protein